MNTKPEEETHSNSTTHYQPQHPPSSSTPNPPPPQSESDPNNSYTDKQGTHVMGPVLSSVPPPSSITKPEEETHSNSTTHYQPQPPPSSSTSNPPPPQSESDPNDSYTEKQGTHGTGPVLSSVPPPSSNTKPEEETHSSSHYQPQPPPSSSTPNPPPPQSESDPNNSYTEKQGTNVTGPVLSSVPPPSSNTKHGEETHSNSNTHHQPPPSSSTPNPPPPESDPNNNNTEKWGTHVMGPPAAPSSHPDNQKASLWRAEEHQPQHPYVQHSPIEHKSTHNPLEPAIHVFNSWTNKAESLARNIWQNLKTSSSLSDAVYGKVGLTTKVITGGGFEALYKQTFTTVPNEKLKKTFACYLSTSTGPVAGTLYLSNFHVAFCSDRPLSFTAPSGEQAWSYYKAMVPLEKRNSIDPISMTDNPSEKYIKIDTVDGHDLWFMGFVNYDKASHHLSQSSSEFTTTAATAAAQPVDGSVAG